MSMQIFCFFRPIRCGPPPARAEKGSAPAGALPHAVYFSILQVMPCGVSVTTTCRAASVSRIASAVPQSFALRAAARFSTV